MHYCHNYIRRVFFSSGLLLLYTVCNKVVAQEKKFEDYPRKGSYLYYGQPAFEDNSFLIEEAFNQETGVLQHVFNWSWDDFNQRNISCSFTQEIPLINLQHQLSYTLSYAYAGNAGDNSKHGFGDTYVSYRPLLLGEKDWAMVIPRFTLILPTGSAANGFGAGAWGGQFNLAVTKRLSRKVVSHYNLGATYYYRSDKYVEQNDQQVLVTEKNLLFENIGVSFIWYPVRRFNLMLEYVSNFTKSIEDDGTLTYHHQKIVNPGIRYCSDNGRVQIVPGIGVPVRFQEDEVQAGVFLYLSFEPDYLPFYKAKSL